MWWWPQSLGTHSAMLPIKNAWHWVLQWSYWNCSTLLHVADFHGPKDRGVMPKVIQTWHAKNWVLVKFESVQDHISTTLFSVLRAHPFRFLITKHKSSRELFNVYCDCAILLMTPSFPLVFVWITIQYWKWAGR